MTNYKKYICALLLTFAAGIAMGQTNGSNSSYSRFGLGTLNDQSQGFNKAMGGIGQGFRAGNCVNMTNPASYSAIDSLTFLFDVGMNVSMGNMKSGASRINVTNCSLDYVNMGFRIAKGMGFSAGFIPFSTIGYNFSHESKVANDYTTTQAITTDNTYYGDGGLHQMYIGVGWNPFSQLSIEVNAGYIWGTYNHQLTQAFYEGTSSSKSYSGLNSTHDAQIKTYKIDIGLQYPIHLTKEDLLTIGVTAGIGHKIKNDATLTRYPSTGDSVQVVAKNAFDLPYTYGFGATWKHGSNLLVGADYKYEQWSKCRIPEMSTASGSLTYTPQKGYYMNRSKIAVGAQYIKNPLGSYINRIQWRMGANFSTPYLVVNNQDGPREYGLSVGAALPISNKINHGTMVNVSLQWMQRSPSVSNMITENYFTLSLGATFNESWFMKFKIK